MAKLHGWLFLDEHRTRLRFVEDTSQPSATINPDWSVLLNDDLLEQFVAAFNGTPTTEGPLSGWRFDADADEIARWLAAHASPND